VAQVAGTLGCLGARKVDDDHCLAIGLQAVCKINRLSNQSKDDVEAIT
jgi:hypothetical protein